MSVRVLRCVGGEEREQERRERKRHSTATTTHEGVPGLGAPLLGIPWIFGETLMGRGVRSPRGSSLL